MFVGLSPGTGESTEAWADFPTDLRERGLAPPLLIVSDGAKGLLAAIEQICPKALRQRCLIHRLRNVVANIPTGMHAEVRDGYWAIFDTTDLGVEPGPQLVEIVDNRIEAFAAKYCDVYPGGDADPAYRQSRADGPSAVPGRTPRARSTFEFH